MLIWLVQFILYGAFMMFMIYVAGPIIINIIKPYTKSYTDTERDGTATLISIVFSLIIMVLTYDEGRRLAISILRALLS